jgi:ribosomal-protein-alanine N-acetyltransferase
MTNFIFTNTPQDKKTSHHKTKNFTRRCTMTSPQGTVTLRLLQLADAEALLTIMQAGREVYERFQPAKPDHHYTVAAVKEEIEAGLKRQEAGEEYTFGIFADQEGMVGRIRLSAIHRGFWQNANLGYFVSSPYQGRGYAAEAVRQAVAFAFGEIGLHRVQAAVMPWNPASQRVMDKAGFRREGLAERYLQINGVWEDHIIFALTAEDRMDTDTDTDTDVDRDRHKG